MYVQWLKGSPNRKTIARLRFFRLSWLLRHCKHIFNMPCMYSHVYIIYIYIYIVYVCIYLLFYRLRPNIKHIAHIRSRRIEGWLVRCISRNNNNNSWFSWVAAVPGPGTPSRNVCGGSPGGLLTQARRRHHFRRTHSALRLIPECVSRLRDPHLGRSAAYPLVIRVLYMCVSMCTHIGVVSDSDWVRPKANHLVSFFSAKEELATYVPNWQATPPVQQCLPPRPAPPRRAPSDSTCHFHNCFREMLGKSNSGDDSFAHWFCVSYSHSFVSLRLSASVQAVFLINNAAVSRQTDDQTKREMWCREGGTPTQTYRVGKPIFAFHENGNGNENASFHALFAANSRKFPQNSIHGLQTRMDHNENTSV